MTKEERREKYFKEHESPDENLEYLNKYRAKQIEKIESPYLKKIKYMDIADERLNGKSLRDIGSRKGVTGERIRQILKKYFSDVKFPIFMRSKIRNIEIKCLKCKKIIVCKAYVYNLKRKFCSKECCWNFRFKKRIYLSKMSKSDRKEFHRKRCNEYYHKHKQENRFRKKISEYNRRAASKRKNK